MTISFMGRNTQPPSSEDRGVGRHVRRPEIVLQHMMTSGPYRVRSLYLERSSSNEARKPRQHHPASTTHIPVDLRFISTVPFLFRIMRHGQLAHELDHGQDARATFARAMICNGITARSARNPILLSTTENAEDAEGQVRATALHVLHALLGAIFRKIFANAFHFLSQSRKARQAILSLAFLASWREHSHSSRLHVHIRLRTVRSMSSNT